MNTNYDSTADTLKHIKRVSELLNNAAIELITRANVHDQSKLEEPEKAEFDRLTPILKDLTYGTPEYAASLKELDIALTHHYKHNSHHPEHVYQMYELWKPVFNYETRYEISNYGRIRNNKKILKPHVTPKGYIRIQLYNGITNKNFFIHTLVANAFLAPSEINRKQVNHKDGNKLNNNFINLEWVSPSDNVQHAYDNGLISDTYKYIVHCNELDITTLGTHKMERELIKLGYANASAAGIWRCINSENEASHLNLTFITYNINEYNELNSMVNTMNLFDIIEMLLDWKAATERTAGGNIYKSIEINTTRFNMSTQLRDIFINTAEKLGW